MRAWLLMLACAMAIWGGGLVVAQVAGARWGGLSGDFPCFYAAGSMVRQGRAAQVYAPEAIAAAERSVRPSQVDAYLPFFYPPPFLLVCWAVSLLPYWIAYAGFMAAGLLALAAAARMALPHGFRVLAVLAYPGIWITVLTGQNGLLSASCLAWFSLLADSRPALAGACLGLLACKPQLAICIPFALVASRRWTTLFACCACIGALSLLSLRVLGPAPWLEFLHGGRLASTAITGGMITQARIQSAFVAARLLGAGLAGAAVAQACVAAAALCVLVYVSRRKPSGPALGAALTTCTLLVTPYAMDYDLVCCAPALAYAANAPGWTPYGRIIVLLAFILPVASGMISLNTHLQIAPVVLAALLYVVVSKVKTGGPGGMAHPPQPSSPVRTATTNPAPAAHIAASARR